jgi:hypothetical protein
MMVEEKKRKERTKEEKKKEEEGKKGEIFWNLSEGWASEMKKSNSLQCLVWFRLNGLGSSQNGQNSLIQNWAHQNYTVCGDWWKVHQRSPPAQKQQINMTWLLLSVSDCPSRMIGPGGLLLVVPHYLFSQFAQK